MVKFMINGNKTSVKPIRTIYCRPSLPCGKCWYDGSCDYSDGFCYRMIEDLWKNFDDVLLDEDEDSRLITMYDYQFFIGDKEILSLPAGTDREDIWHWFDQNHPKGVAYLLYGEEKEQKTHEDRLSKFHSMWTFTLAEPDRDEVHFYAESLYETKEEAIAAGKFEASVCGDEYFYIARYYDMKDGEYLYDNIERIQTYEIVGAWTYALDDFSWSIQEDNLFETKEDAFLKGKEEAEKVGVDKFLTAQYTGFANGIYETKCEEEWSLI